MKNKKIKWFDLRRFGAALKVIPNSPLRGVPITCLEIGDTELYEKTYTLAHSSEDKLAIQAHWKTGKESLGFTGSPHVSYGDNDKKILRLFSTKVDFSLTELNLIAPGLEAADLVDMDVNDIALSLNPNDELTQEWATFSEEVLSKEAVDVWVLKNNSFEAIPYQDAGSISEICDEKNDTPYPLLKRNILSAYRGLAGKLDSLHFRQNALTAFYVDQEAAIADGQRQDNLVKATLPFALPIFITGKGKVIALKDVRFAPEIMDMSPEQYFRGKNGIIVPVIRDIVELKSKLAGEVSKIEAWGRDIEANGQGASSFDSALFWDSLNQVFSSLHEISQKHTTLGFNLKSIVAPVNTESPDFHVKPLVELNESDMCLLAGEIKRYIGADDEVDKGMLYANLLAVGQRLIAEKANLLAQQQLRSVAEKVQSERSENKEGETKLKHVDAGEKIGGARKDFSRRAMRIEDLEVMNEYERRTFVTKQNVWPPLNYVELRESGVTAEAALALKILKDTLNTSPDLNFGPGRKGRISNHFPSYDPDDAEVHAEYVKAIALVRDELSSVKTIDDIKQSMEKLYDIGNCQTNYISGGTPTQIQWGRDFSTLVFEGSHNALPSKIRSVLRRKIDRFDNPTEDQKWASLIKPKRVKSEAQIEENKKKAELERALQRPHLASVKRDGTDWRGGRDIVADDLIEQFGFRAVEYGLWLDQGERQQVINMAFDSFCDLAECLNLPPKEISFGGDLAIAFGSRGSGGKNAASAHFEPARFVINLTRMNGAGSLAHEWFHALDAHMAERKGYASELCKDGKSAIGELSRAFLSRPSTGDEVLAKSMADYMRGKSNVMSWLYSETPETRAKLSDILNEGVDKAKSLFFDSAVKYLQTNPGRDYGTGGVVPGQLMMEAVEENMLSLRMACDNKKGFTKVKSKVEGNLRWLACKLASAVTVEAAVHLGVPLSMAFLKNGNALDSNYLKNAKQLDEARSEPYWATLRELYARAGESYVMDKIVGNGLRSDYLVHGVEADRYANHPFGNPYPTDDEREQFAELFDQLFNEYRLQCVSRSELQNSVSIEP